MLETKHFEIARRGLGPKSSLFHRARSAIGDLFYERSRNTIKGMGHGPRATRREKNAMPITEELVRSLVGHRGPHRYNIVFDICLAAGFLIEWMRHSVQNSSTTQTLLIAPFRRCHFTSTSSKSSDRTTPWQRIHLETRCLHVLCDCPTSIFEAEAENGRLLDESPQYETCRYHRRVSFYECKIEIVTHSMSVSKDFQLVVVLEVVLVETAITSLPMNLVTGLRKIANEG
ncbi:unnamed protein product [Leptosia nina]|uniref:Uncharacterized protein n=1 Tax=Leptosia nina TaxID=320188 RepID=A0AAV1IWZ0_9NEOP